VQVTTYAADPPATETLPGPYAWTPPADGLQISPAVLNLARAEVRALLQATPVYAELPPERRRQLAYDLVKIAAYTAALLQEEFALTEQLDQVPMIVRRTIAPMADAASAPSVPLASAQAAPKPPPPPADEFSPRAVREAAKLTKAQLNAVDFPTFVADLIRGTYNAVIDASIKQMEAYAELISNVAKTVAQFEADNITDNQARDYLASQYPAHFRVDATGDAPKLVTKDGAEDRPMPNFKNDLELPEDVTSVDADTAESTLVPAARRKIARGRQQLLASMVMMGINRIVVTTGRIYAKMGFHIDAHDYGSAATASEFDESNYSAATGWFGFGGGASANSVTYVTSTKKDSNDAINLTTDLTGEVELRFKSDYLPLERMATPQMIGAIQGNTPNPAANTPQQQSSKS
jgi:hypothetical protein